MAWFYMSFADENGWLGAVLVDAEDIHCAVAKSHELGFNPGGEIAFGEMEPDWIPPSEKYRNRLITSFDELRAATRESDGGTEDDTLVNLRGEVVPRSGEMH